MYVYIRSETKLFTVGFYDPSGTWMPESDWRSADEAAERVHFLNGGRDQIKFLPSKRNRPFAN